MIILEIGIGTKSSNDTICDEFSEQNKLKSTIKAPCSIPNLHFFKANQMKI